MTEASKNLDLEINEAFKTAETLGNFNLSEYLALRTNNDAIRQQSIRWLFDSVLEIVTAFNQHNASIEINQTQAHRFKIENSYFTGSLLELKQGVRCFRIEAGWTQSIDDSVLRYNALACAKFSHFGYANNSDTLYLINFESSPLWFSLRDESNFSSFQIEGLRAHFERLLL
ncbi:MAG: hypothetical protein ACK5NT_13175 [Pyrinomonadaceae bacterium]